MEGFTMEDLFAKKDLIYCIYQEKSFSKAAISIWEKSNFGFSSTQRTQVSHKAKGRPLLKGKIKAGMRNDRRWCTPP